MTDTTKIAKFRELAEQDPKDELAHLSLGNALMEAGEHQEAAQSYQRVLALNNRSSKGHERLAAAQIACGHKDLALQTLGNGYLVAHKQGDLEPMNAMGAMFAELGVEPPKVGTARAPSAGAAASGDWACARCGGGGAKLEHRPFKGELGEKVLASICQTCWTEWVGMGTKVINELRLPMYDPTAQAEYDKHMVEFLSLE